MADHSKPVLTSTYANFVTELDARFDDLAVGLDPAFSTPTNLPNNSIRWSSASNKWEKWNLTVWSPLSAGYDIDIANGSIINSPISGSTGSFTTLAASGAFSLTGDQVQVSEGGTGATTAATARANLGAAPTASPAFTGTASFWKIAAATMFAGAGATEGGELWLEKPASGSTIVGNGVVDLSSDAIRFFESGGTSRGAYIYLPSCAGGVGSAIWHQGNDGAGSGLDADLLDGQQGAYYAPEASPTFTGVPAAPTATAGTNTTQLATTAFVQAATPDSSATVAGLVELATTAEAAAGTDTVRAVTPAGLAAAFAGDLNFYTGAVTTNLAFPVGSILIVSGISGVARNAVKAIYFYPSEEAYGFAVNGSPLTGTWRSRGFSSGAALMQRTA